MMSLGLVAWCVLLGALFGTALGGLVIGVTVVILASFVGSLEE